MSQTAMKCVVWAALVAVVGLGLASDANAIHPWRGCGSACYYPSYTYSYYPSYAYGYYPGCCYYPTYSYSYPSYNCCYYPSYSYTSWCGGGCYSSCGSYYVDCCTPTITTTAPVINGAVPAVNGQVPTPAANGQQPTPAVKPSAEGEAKPAAPAAPESPQPAPPSNPSATYTLGPGSAMLTIYCPADAKVTINGLETKTTGVKRRYVSHGLQPGMMYRYDVRVECEGEKRFVERYVKRDAEGNPLVKVRQFEPGYGERSMEMSLRDESYLVLVGADGQQLVAMNLDESLSGFVLGRGGRPVVTAKGELLVLRPEAGSSYDPNRGVVYISARGVTRMLGLANDGLGVLGISEISGRDEKAGGQTKLRPIDLRDADAFLMLTVDKESKEATIRLPGKLRAADAAEGKEPAEAAAPAAELGDVIAKMSEDGRVQPGEGQRIALVRDFRLLKDGAVYDREVIKRTRGDGRVESERVVLKPEFHVQSRDIPTTEKQPVILHRVVELQAGKEASATFAPYFTLAEFKSDADLQDRSQFVQEYIQDKKRLDFDQERLTRGDVALAPPEPKVAVPWDKWTAQPAKKPKAE
jgi:uncharacterized protein (TIGR03000 family)